MYESQPKQLKKAKWPLCLLYFHMLKSREAYGKSCSCTHTKHTLYSAVSQHEVLFTTLYFYNVHVIIEVTGIHVDGNSSVQCVFLREI